MRDTSALNSVGSHSSGYVEEAIEWLRTQTEAQAARFSGHLADKAGMNDRMLDENEQVDLT